MKIITVVGARPQFIKVAAVSKTLRSEHEEILIHTGQHYDKNMSDIFFDELSIPKPNYNLGISGGTHAQMTAKMMVGIEEIMMNEKPDVALLYGDTNSTLAAALVAAKLHIPIVHVEAGVRTRSKTNPEEMNRICTDHLSSALLSCTEESYQNLVLENKKDTSYFVGDPMFDAFLIFSEKANSVKHSLTNFNSNSIEIPSEYYYLTCHREENTQNENNLKEILSAMQKLDSKVVYPVHPRNKNIVLELCEKNNFDNIILCEPVGYLTSIYLVANAKKIITDSGGLQREAFFANKQAITILDFKVWPETMVGNRNQMCKPLENEILEKLKSNQVVDEKYMPFGDGNSAKKILEVINNLKETII